jgi:gamma-butyrobetaine dioxygenase
LFDPHELPDDLAIASIDHGPAELTVRFTDGVSSVYALATLCRDIEAEDTLPAAVPWVAADGVGPMFDWRVLKDSDDHLLACLRQFLSRGFVILDNTPTARESILAIGRRFGFVRETNFGQLFEVYTRPVRNDLAYTSVALSPHTDNPYRDPVPGIQLLHCLDNQTSGGLSTLVDSLSVCKRLRDEDPDGFRLLTEVPVIFRFRDPDTHLCDRHPLVATDGAGNPVGIHYSPRLDETPLLDPATMLAYHRARKGLGRLLADPAFELRFRLAPGTLMMFDNNRILHGRTSYDPEEGMRHLQGCYIDRDGPRSLFRILLSRFTGQEDAA